MKSYRPGIRHIILLLTALWLSACAQFDSEMGKSILRNLSSSEGGLTQEKIIAGLKQALEVGAERAVERVSRSGGYLQNADIRIPLPAELKGMGEALRKVGMGSQVDRFEKKMNESAELAAKSATPVFVKAIAGMSFSDAKAILKGDDTAATDYFRENTSTELEQKYQPVVVSEMEKLGAVKLYQDLEKRYNALPLLPDISFNVEEYVTGKALEGLFTMVAREEKKIRENPAARTTDLLREVFGSE
ncbi:MAG: DUF4197 domain-containing protein [Candidatus Sumerlaeia bacterium]